MLSHRTSVFSRGVVKKYENAGDEAQGYIPVGGWFQSTGVSDMIVLLGNNSPPNAREEAM